MTINASKIGEDFMNTLIQELDVICETNIDKDGKKTITSKGQNKRGSRKVTRLG